MRWLDGGDAATAGLAREVSIGGAAWRVHREADDDRAPRLTLETCIPLDALAVSRQFAVGGVMLDIGAGFGSTSIPRAVLGDFGRVYAAEGGDEAYSRLQVPSEAVRFIRIGRTSPLLALLRRRWPALPFRRSSRLWNRASIRSSFTPSRAIVAKWQSLAFREVLRHPAGRLLDCGG
jgi:hypothetical protein